MTGCPFTTEPPIGRTFRQQMKGGRKKQVSACRAKKRSYFYGFSHCTTSLLGISRLLLIFLPLLRWIQRNSRQQQQIEPQSFLNSTYRRCTIRTMHLSDEPYPSTCCQEPSCLLFSVRIHARPQYNYVCSISFQFCCFQKVFVLYCCKSACYKQVSKKCKKNQMICLAVRLKPPTFAPAIERDAALKQCVTDLVRQAQESLSFIKDSAPDILPQPG